MGVSGMDLVDNLRDGLAIRATHDVVGSTTNYKYGLVDSLPDFAQVQGLQLLIERSRPAILAVGGVVLETFPVRVLGDDLAGAHALDEVEGIELNKSFN